MSDSQSGLNRGEGDLIPSETTRHLAYAEASVMLIECLMLLLIEQRVLTSQQMIATVENVIATKRRMIQEGEHAKISAIAAGMLSTIANSLAAAGDGTRAR
jgi:hypothetical protein